MIQLIVLFPLIGFLTAGLFSKSIGHRGAELITSALMVASAVISWCVFYALAIKDGQVIDVVLFSWLNLQSLHCNWCLHIDSLTSVMLIVVCSVSALVHIYSIGYMHHDKSRSRFFSYLSLFTFMMLMLVTSDNLIQLFFGWEGVGLASYLLIGFWFERNSANNAAIKAFVVNRVGDFSFLLGIFSIYSLFGSVNFAEIFDKLAHNSYNQELNFLFFHFQNKEVLFITCLFLLIGAMGKSAQFLLHVWLPDAMEGPTPVSALIHAATMVTAGIFMIARLSPIFDSAPYISEIIIIIGAITAFFAATIGLVQNDIKRIIAYSTCSQLGYMFVALGVGAYSVAVFHLFTHAFFKALLFLGAGSVIHAVSDEQDIRKMGGLYKYIPITYIMMLTGTFALTGLGIPSTLVGTAGFFSKDAIIEASYVSPAYFAPFACFLLIFAAFLTSFYSWRLIFLTFHGKIRASVDVMHQIHESGKIMLIPLLLLSIGALLSGVLFKDYFIGELYNNFWKNSLFTSEFNHILHDMHHVPNIIKISPFIAMVLGFILSFIFYILWPPLPKKLANIFGILYRFLLNKWYFDEVYNYLIVRPVICISNILWQIFDINIIDRFGPNGIALQVLNVTSRFVKMQTGFIYDYAFAFILGISAIFIWITIGSNI